MARWIGIDYGKKRIGIASTDPLGLIAFPLKTLTSEEIIPFLKSYTIQENIAGIVIGLPLDLQNKENEITELVKKFTRLLQRHLPTLPFYHHDERFTSILAQRSLLESGLPKKKRQEKKRLDAISASLILTSFLELHKRGKSQCIKSL